MLTNTPEALLSEKLNAYQDIALLYFAIKSNIPDILHVAPQTIQQINNALNYQIDPLERIMHGLEIIGFCHKNSTNQYALSELGHLLIKDNPSPVREKILLISDQYWGAWANLSFSAANNTPAFNHVHGMSAWQCRTEHPEQGTIFNRWMEKSSHQIAHQITPYINLSNAHTIVDIAGGNGVFLSEILNNHQHLQGILLEQASVIAEKKYLLHNKPIQAIEFDLFKPFPTIQADIFILKSILHDWEDEKCIHILKHIHRMMTPNNTLMIIERLIDDNNLSKQTIMLDIHMLLVTSGRERSFKQYANLLTQAGFCEPTKISTDCGFYIIESKPYKTAI